MSGFVCLVTPTPQPELIEQLTNRLTFRGPDDYAHVSVEGAELGFTWLRTHPSSSCDQPLTHNGRHWLLGDIRLDARGELASQLRQSGCSVDSTLSDASLVWYAFQVWGKECVHRLQGDFTFVIWDNQQKSLFAARDQFGIRPLFYAYLADGFLLSNTEACVQAHPSVSNNINDDVIAEILLFGWNRNLAATLLQDIKKVPPAHTLSWQAGQVSMVRYWSLAVPGVSVGTRPGDIITQFKTLLTQAVKERTDCPTIEIGLSGGLDSTSIAVIAHQQLADQFNQPHLHAYTYVESDDDAEGLYAKQVTDHLGIDLKLIRLTRPQKAWPDINSFSPHTANPSNTTPKPVALSGMGGDAVLHPSQLTWWQIGKHTGWSALGNALKWQWELNRNIPPLYLRTTWKRKYSIAEIPPLPSWLNPDFVQQYQLAERWSAFNQQFVRYSSPHPYRPEAHFNLTARLWPQSFEENDPTNTLAPTSVRYPFFDLRLVNFLLALPPIPWFVDKTILRQAMKQLLPERVRQRPKTLLNRQPSLPPSLSWVERQFTLLPELTQYFDLEKVRVIFESANTFDKTRLEIGWQIRRIGQWFIYTAHRI